MWQSRVNFERSALHNLGRHHRGNADWYDLIIVTMHDQCRHVELLEVFSKVGLREGLYTFVRWPEDWLASIARENYRASPERLLRLAY